MDTPGTLGEMLAKGRRPFGLKRCRVFEREGDFMETSPFGWRVHPATGEKRVHGGIDGAVWTGSALGESWIVAPLEGTVKEARDAVPGFDRERPEGNFVSLCHDGGVETRYYHLERGTVQVKPGDRVRPGDRLGYMGKTGLATGEHLHFELVCAGRRANPEEFLKTGKVQSAVC